MASESHDQGRARLRLTKRTVEATVPPATRELIVWDSDLKGFGLRVSVTGRRTYFLQSRATDGRQIKIKIGVHGAVTADQARTIACRELGKIAAGENPAVQRQLTRGAERKRLVAPTMRSLAEEYIRSHAEVFKRPSSVADDRSMLGLPRADGKAPRRPGPRRKAATILGELGARKVADITRRELADLHRKMAATPAQANRALALLSKMFNLAIQWELRTDNPVRGLQRYAEQPRERYLDGAELKRLSIALNQHPNATIVNAIRLLLLTGARRSEVLNATWSQFDLDSGVWVKPSAHTKQKRSHRVPLSPAAVELLRSVRAKMIEAATDRAGVVALKKIGAQVFPGRFGVGPLTDIKKSWSTICAAADLRDVHLHDLRHTYASLLASDGISLPIIGQLLGHTQPGTTARYAHLFDNPLREATTRVAKLLSESNFGAGLVELKPAER